MQRSLVGSEMCIRDRTGPAQTGSKNPFSSKRAFQTISGPLQIDSPFDTIPKEQKISIFRWTDACFVKDFEFSIDFLAFWPGCRARTWIVQGLASLAGPVLVHWSGPAPSLPLVTGVALHHRVFLWIGAGACPCTIQVLALHPGDERPYPSHESWL